MYWPTLVICILLSSWSSWNSSPSHKFTVSTVYYWCACLFRFWVLVVFCLSFHGRLVGLLSYISMLVSHALSILCFSYFMLFVLLNLWRLCFPWLSLTLLSWWTFFAAFVYIATFALTDVKPFKQTNPETPSLRVVQYEVYVIVESLCVALKIGRIAVFARMKVKP